MRATRRLAAPALAAAALLITAAVSLALPQQQGSVDLLNQADGQWQGPGEAAGSSATGSSIVGLPDIFHVGRGAVAIGAPEADPHGRQSAGSVYVVSGQPKPGVADLTALTGRGYRIDGAVAGDQLGFALAAFRLANGHLGLALGAPYASPAKRPGGGAVYVIDLARLHHDIDLAAGKLDRAVVGVLAGPQACAEAGYALADAGSVGRGRGEALLIGAPGFDPQGCPVIKPSGPVGGNTGAAYLVPPNAVRSGIDLGAPATGVGTFLGATSGDRAGSAITGAGLPGSVVIGAPYASAPGRAASGAAYLIRGVKPGQSVSLAHLPAGSTEFAGAAAGDALGFAVSRTVAVTRRGRGAVPELILGAPQASPLGRAHAGSVYVVASEREPGLVDLATIAKPHGEPGTAVQGADAGDEIGYAVAGVGDLNGDGRPDIAIGAPFVNSQTGQDRLDNGAVYVLYGSLRPGIVDLGAARAPGYVAFGARDSDEAGTAVAGVSNESGDGRADLLIGAPFAENTTASTPAAGGAVYVIYGFGRPALRYRPNSLTLRLGQPAQLTPTIHATGHASFAISPALPRGLGFNRRTGRIAGTARRVSRRTVYTVQMTDLSGVAQAELTLAVAR